jgi:hypothetical protein
MSQKSEKQPTQGSPRRAFFGQLLTAVGGGMLGGSLLEKLLGSRTQSPDTERPVNIRINPLAVPRSKEGSSSNV